MSWFDILKYLMTPSGEKFVLDIEEFKKFIRAAARPLVFPEYSVMSTVDRKRAPYASRIAFTMDKNEQVPTLSLTFRHARSEPTGENTIGTTKFHFTLRRMWEEGETGKLYPVPVLKAANRYYVVDIMGPSNILRELKQTPVNTTSEFASQVILAMVDVQVEAAPGGSRGVPIKQPEEKTQEQINRELEEANYDPENPNITYRMEEGKMRRGPKAHLTPAEQKRKDDLADRKAKKDKIGRRGR